eukprot:TRINITY_DN2138_c0_g1_i1.p1 TRINITY_DN2138_c0_g1~~TRINITY_DN2138_c0_g1_i1.p1  ORF type:complete len:351 (+),score=95.33 TRINITY_DN2138_c0_g1_i1:39-1091(+)
MAQDNIDNTNFNVHLLSSNIENNSVPIVQQYNVYQYPSNLIQIPTSQSYNMYPPDMMNRNEYDDDDDIDDNEDSKTSKKRLNWTPELHSKFVAAIKDLGIKSAVPRTILKHMGETGNLSRENIASHLQKYRLLARKQRGIKRGVNLRDNDLPLRDSLLDKFQSEQASGGKKKGTYKKNNVNKMIKSNVNINHNMSINIGRAVNNVVTEAKKNVEVGEEEEEEETISTAVAPMVVSGIPVSQQHLLMYPPVYSPNPVYSPSSQNQYPSMIQSTSPYQSVSPMGVSPLTQAGYLMMMYPNYPVQIQNPYSFLPSVNVDEGIVNTVEPIDTNSGSETKLNMSSTPNSGAQLWE